MPLGFDRQRQVVAQNDTAKLTATLYDDQDQPLTAKDVFAVSWMIQKPDNTKVPEQGIVNDDGTGSTTFNATDLPGHYTAIATFTLGDGTKRSARTNFEVFDPFEDTPDTQVLTICELVWTKLEDCFDAEDAGPWLRDQTLDFFNEEKMAKFINDGVFDLNQYNPPTNVTLDQFVLADGTPTADSPLLAQAVFLPVLRQLMRAYVEQPLPSGAQVAWQDRRDYLMRWQSVYQEEKLVYDKWVKLWKRQFLQLGHAKSLVGSKAGRLIPAPNRTRNVGRGYF